MGIDEDIKEAETIAKEDLPEVAPYTPPQPEYTNINAGIAISAAATTIIAVGTPMIAAEKPFGFVLVLAGIGVYFIKAYLLKKNCI